MMGAVVMTRPQEQVQVVQRFFGKCLTEDGEMVTLVVRATSEAEASRKLHGGYRITMVVDILTKEQIMMERMLRRPSLLKGFTML